MIQNKESKACGSGDCTPSAWSDPRFQRWVEEQARSRNLFSESSSDPRINVAAFAWQEALSEPTGPASRPAAEPCPRGADKPEPTCTNRHQCWEPCGELGKSEEHVRPGLQATHTVIPASADSERLDWFATTLPDVVRPADDDWRLYVKGGSVGRGKTLRAAIDDARTKDRS